MITQFLACRGKPDTKSISSSSSSRRNKKKNDDAVTLSMQASLPKFLAAKGGPNAAQLRPERVLLKQLSDEIGDIRKEMGSMSYRAASEEGRSSSST